MTRGQLICWITLVAIIPSIAYVRFRGLDPDAEVVRRVCETCVTLGGTVSPKATNVVRYGGELQFHLTTYRDGRNI
jgi:hypothetical protein